MVSDCGMVEDIAWRIVVTVGIHSVFFPFFLPFCTHPFTSLVVGGDGGCFCCKVLFQGY